MPIQDGWHPYFSFGGSIDDLQLEFQSKEMVEFNEALIPTGKLLPYQEYGALKKIGAAEFDNCFTVNFAECYPPATLCVKGSQYKNYNWKSIPIKLILTCRSIHHRTVKVLLSKISVLYRMLLIME
jgi:aldose 1-epimerase